MTCMIRGSALAHPVSSPGTPPGMQNTCPFEGHVLRQGRGPQQRLTPAQQQQCLHGDHEISAELTALLNAQH